MLFLNNFIIKNIKIRGIFRKLSSNNNKKLILGIETSCDDTGCAIVDNHGNILGKALNSQELIHLNNGGIIPPIAQTLHRENIEKVVNSAIAKAQINFRDLDAIAVTVKPGLPLSLLIGMKYAKYLCQTHKKSIIPIHHMEAHALTARMIETIEFPFLCLLISGGHCLLAIVKTVDEFLLMGESLDDAPGEAFDKTARRLKLRNIPEFAKLSGGQAIELAASKADNIYEFEFNCPLSKYRDCNFSMAGLKNRVLRYIIQEEKKHGIEADGVIPNVFNLCAGFQFAIARHLCQRTQRAMEYIQLNDLLPQNNLTLVMSGGSACNNFITKTIEIVCNKMNYRLIRPPPHLCTDNGIMIAWNGMERFLANKGVTTDLSTIDIASKAPLGVSIKDEITNAHLKCDWIKIKTLLKTKENSSLGL